MKITNFRGDLTDISAKKEALPVGSCLQTRTKQKTKTNTQPNIYGSLLSCKHDLLCNNTTHISGLPEQHIVKYAIPGSVR